MLYTYRTNKRCFTYHRTSVVTFEIVHKLRQIKATVTHYMYIRNILYCNYFLRRAAKMLSSIVTFSGNSNVAQA